MIPVQVEPPLAMAKNANPLLSRVVPIPNNRNIARKTIGKLDIVRWIPDAVTVHIEPPLSGPEHAGAHPPGIVPIAHNRVIAGLAVDKEKHPAVKSRECHRSCRATIARPEHANLPAI